MLTAKLRFHLAAFLLSAFNCYPQLLFFFFTPKMCFVSADVSLHQKIKKKCIEAVYVFPSR